MAVLSKRGLKLHNPYTQISINILVSFTLVREFLSVSCQMNGQKENKIHELIFKNLCLKTIRKEITSDSSATSKGAWLNHHSILETT